MKKLFSTVRGTRAVSLVKDNKGATAIEYGLLAALISVAMIAGVSAVGTNVASTFNSVDATLTTANAK